MESFILVSQSAQFSHYAALLVDLFGKIVDFLLGPSAPRKPPWLGPGIYSVLKIHKF